MHKLQMAGAALAAAALLAGCGSSGGDDSPPAQPSTEVPDSATSSVGGLVAYVAQLIANTSETSRPVVLGDVTLPVDDTAAPSALP